MIGQVLNGTYRLTDLLGSGGYADVYLARDLRTNTVVASSSTASCSANRLPMHPRGPPPKGKKA